MERILADLQRCLEEAVRRIRHEVSAGRLSAAAADTLVADVAELASCSRALVLATWAA
jgi:hypothetical protein